MSDEEERTEDPTGRKIDQAREKGQVARSRELVTFAVTMTALVLVIVRGPDLMVHFKTIMIQGLVFDRHTLALPMKMLERFNDAAMTGMLMLIPIFGLVIVATVASSVLIGGWLFTLSSIAPNLSKLNPIHGFQNLFSPRSALEMGKTILKASLIGGIAVDLTWRQKEAMIALIAMPPLSALTKLADMLTFIMLVVTGSLILLAAIDIPYQLWQYKKGLKMTKEEVKREHKESEGSPEVKGRIRQLQREAASRRMMSNIPKADVIVTNPTRYAVALRYEEGMPAPQVVAKGTLKVAERILELGKEHHVPVMRVPPFARALYHHAEIEEDIPQALFKVAAEVLAYIFQLKHYQNFGGISPIYPSQLEVPPELDPEHDKPEAD